LLKVGELIGYEGDVTLCLSEPTGLKLAYACLIYSAKVSLTGFYGFGYSIGLAIGIVTG
jgi:hypothetical protein